MQNVLHDTELGPDEYRTTNLENTEITKTFWGLFHNGMHVTFMWLLHSYYQMFVICHTICDHPV